MPKNLQIDYIEFYSSELEATEIFFAQAFDWNCIAYGPDYRDIQRAGTGGGIERNTHKAPLIVLRTDDLENAFQQISDAGAEITKDIFSFPGGRRFEFREPGGTEMAVWCADAT